MTSLRSRILHSTLKRVTAAVATSLPIKEQRTRLDELARRGIRLPRGVTVCSENADGVHSEWSEPAIRDEGRVLLYLHGGGYCICSLDTHRGLVARLARASQSMALAAAYRLAPENPFPAALSDALTAYRWLLQHGYSSSQIAIGGDSAGGGLTLATTLTLRDAGEPLPGALFLLSPWTDLTFSGESVHTRREIDPILSADGGLQYAPTYLGMEDAANPLISPIFAEYHDFPPTLIHVGNDEILLDDSTRLAAKMQAAGVKVELKVWPGMWHVFQAFAPWTPEAMLSIEEIGTFLQAVIPARLKVQTEP